VAQERRATTRLPHYDYTSPGAYFVTVCSYGRRSIFDDPATQTLVEEVWNQIPSHFPGARTDEFVVMPNHVHGIIWILGRDGSDGGARARQRMVGAQHAAPLRRNVAPGSLAAVVRSFKSAVTRRVNQMRGAPRAHVWQRNYYERVVRSEAELHSVREYIRLNPAKWELDRENPGRVTDHEYGRDWAWLEA
jgi:REP element-mobilizing transposase RayT